MERQEDGKGFAAIAVPFPNTGGPNVSTWTLVLAIPQRTAATARVCPKAGAVGNLTPL